MLVHSATSSSRLHTSTGTRSAGIVDRDAERLPERAIEVETLLQAVTALRRNGILTDAEYEAKHRRLVAQR